MFKKSVCLLLVSLFIITAAGCGTPTKQEPAEKYPAKPITMIVPYGAGGSADLMGRAMEKLSMKYFGQPMVVLNKPGGAATIGWNELAGAKPDGYTIGYVAGSALLQPHYTQTRYHYPTALEPLAQALKLPVLLSVRADQPWQNLEDLINYAKQHPGALKFGHSGLGSGIHIVGEMFVKEAGVNIAQVPFPGGEPESLAALLGGHIQVLFSTPVAIKEHVKTGRVRVLGVAEERRMTDPELKNVPTFKEKGVDVSLNLWFGIAAPKGLPPDVKTRLNEGLKGIFNDPEFIKNMTDLGLPVEYIGPQEFADKWVSESTRLTKIIQETGILERIASQKK